MGRLLRSLLLLLIAVSVSAAPLAAPHGHEAGAAGVATVAQGHDAATAAHGHDGHAAMADTGGCEEAGHGHHGACPDLRACISAGVLLAGAAAALALPVLDGIRWHPCEPASLRPQTPGVDTPPPKRS